ncbi:MAG TPA: hypothetical protein VG940_02350 [Gemmatimonadales bacterium]|nr:hypothetical protein [Gemmatimonadales bacterium]
MAMATGLTIAQRVMVGSLGLPFAFVALAGRELWKDGPLGVELSMVAQALQAFAWTSPSLYYNFACGLQGGIWVGPRILAPFGYLGSTLSINVGDEPRATALGVNLLAITLYVALWLSDRKTEYPPPAPLRPVASDPPEQP